MKLIFTALYFIGRLLFRHRADPLEAKLRSAHSAYFVRMRPSMPHHLVLALIAAEDHRFWRHCGIDPIALCRALWYFAARNKVIGGSTLEQQLARTLTGDKSRTIRRKLRELCMAAVVEATVPKEDIPGLYLSVAYFGWRMNGILEACRRLGFNPSLLTQRQAAELVARLKYPEPSSPSTERSNQIKLRARHVFNLMMAAGTDQSPTGQLGVPNRDTIPDFF
jgi:membrane peptidoglycan carboxypeptidase